MKKSIAKKFFVTIFAMLLALALAVFCFACSTDPKPITPNDPAGSIGGTDDPDDPGTDNPDNPGTDNPDDPDNSGTDNPDNPDDPNNPDNPDDPNNPDNPDDPDNPDNPGTDNPGTDNPGTDDPDIGDEDNEQLRIRIKQLLSELVSGYKLDPYSFLPETMLPMHAPNIIGSDTPKTEADYADFVNTDRMAHHGFGEQWNMIAENLAQSQLFFNALSAVDSVSTAAVAAFNNYIDSNPSDTAQHSFMHGIYSVTIRFDGVRIYYVLDYTNTFPVIGEQKAQIAMSMNMSGADKVVRIQLGDANALTYKVAKNGYSFAIKYLGVRRAFFEISRDADGRASGHIYEYITASGVTDAAIASAADFYVDGNYVSAVGNKADGMIAFDGYISELYDKTTGRLISYEVREEQSIAEKTVTFNTLWYDLADVSGITSVCYKGEEGKEKFYVNGLVDAWKSKKVGGLNVKTASRRFDIEFRTQYFYIQNGNAVEKIAVKVPMLFVQEEQTHDLVADVKSTNGIDIEITVSASDKAKQKSDYDTLVDTFISHKQAVTVDKILEFIGEAIRFDTEQETVA